MAKPYRRRKGKNRPYVGNYRVTVDGRDINLGTKDAQEAQARARLAKQGKWPPEEAAVAAAVDALDPGRHKVPEPSLATAGATTGEGGGTPHAVPPVTHVPPPPEAPSHEPAQSLNDAAAAAAAELADEVEEVTAEQAEQENGVNAELRAIMGELSGGATGGDLLDGICDGASAFLLWAEGKAIELGVNWTLARRKSTMRLQTQQLEQTSLMRKALRVGLKGAAITYFPDFATNLSPGWAIAIGLVGGAGQTVMQGQLIDMNTGQQQAVGDAIAQAQKEAAAAASSTTETTSPPAA